MRINLKKIWFFTDDSSVSKTGSRFVDREVAINKHFPNQTTFRNLLQSIPFFSESDSQAVPEDGNQELKDHSGLVSLADDATAKTRLQKTDRVLAAQIHQLPEVVDEEQTISANTVSLTDELVQTDSSLEPSTHRRWTIRLNSTFITWLQDRLTALQSGIDNLQNSVVTTSNVQGLYTVDVSGNSDSVDSLVSSIPGVSQGKVENIVSLTQVEYDTITPDSETLYVII